MHLTAHKPDSVFLQVQNATFYKGNSLLFESINWTLKEGENWAIVGQTGTGKTSLAEAITGRLFLRSGELSYPFLHIDANKNKTELHIRDVSQILSFQENSHLFDYSNYYYQQRFHATEIEGILTARDFLTKALPDPEDATQAEELCRKLRIAEILPLEFIKLSNGQTRKLRIAKALLQNPALLVLDNPFVGLDEASRKDLHQLIDQLSRLGTKVILTSHLPEFPESTTQILWLDRLHIKGIYTKTAFVSLFKAGQKSVPVSMPAPPLLPAKAEPDFDVAFSFRDVKISYEGNKVLQHINWTVRKGEKWALLGPNGSGKSTLLSLISADHPQAYANNILLFDKKRGSGESIWDIKKRIGFVSPELHLYFRTGMTSREVASTGFMDTLTLKRTLTEGEENMVLSLFGYFQMENLRSRRFLQLSTGEQQVVLLIRSLVKQPDLIIWDEPFQNLDTSLISKSTRLLEHFCRAATTLLFVSHYSNEIPAFVKRYMVLEGGRIRKIEYRQ